MNEKDATRRTVSLPSLIGWLSVCMLAATWGRTIDPQWQSWWGKAGTVGLIAAVVLERTEKTRLRRQSKLHTDAARIVSENRLARLNEQESNRSSVIDAVHELITYASADLNDYPLAVIPLDENDESFAIESARAIHGNLIGISPNTVSFTHGETFDSQVVLLKFKLHKHRVICFVVEMIGTQPTETGFSSTGAVLATGVPDSTSDDVTTHAEISACLSA